MMPHASYLWEQQRHDALRAREKAENDQAIARAKRIGRSVSFIAHDGCEVTATPDGHVFYNASDWW